MNRTVVVLLLAGAVSACAQNEDVQSRVDASRATVKQFAQTLQAELKAAMGAGGPLNAITVCHARAPEIAAELSAKEGWSVGRTSAKARNAANRPDAWESKVLQDFEARKAAGEDPATLEFFEIEQAGAGRNFRYMKAIVIPEQAPCLSCHGTEIAPEVAQKLGELYPEDSATGYSTGDIRGAFTIVQPM